VAFTNVSRLSVVTTCTQICSSLQESTPGRQELPKPFSNHQSISVALASEERKAPFKLVKLGCAG